MENKAEFETIGTLFKIIIYDKNTTEQQFQKIISEIKIICNNFDNYFSRFKNNSFITKLNNKIGKWQINNDFYNLLCIYKKINHYTNGLINPLIGNTISDFGYDKDYSFKEKAIISITPDFKKTIKFYKKRNIFFIKKYYLENKEKVLFDFGAVGKGYLIDLIFNYLDKNKINNFLIDGSGDIRYKSINNKNIICGLEHPTFQDQIIGTLKLDNSALCASSNSRRKWAGKHHYINPINNEFTNEVVGTFVICNNATFADAISSSLFFVSPENLQKITGLNGEKINFEYLIINKNLQIKKSANFNADLF